MANENFEKQFYSSVLQAIDRNDSHHFYNEMQNAIKSGKLEVFQKKAREQLTFDATWVETIKGYMRYVEKIVRNPRLYMEAVEDVTAIEKARKINSRSIQHLSSHVQNVQEIRKDGTIVPSKILSTSYEDTLNIYENRFVMTLISKLAAFVEVRYNSIIESIKSYESNKLAVKSSFKWRNYDIEATIDLKVREEIVDDVSKKNQELLEDITLIRNYCRGFMGSSFYKTMKESARPVTPPILRTNIITKSVDYNACLKLWQFLDSYRQLGVELQILDKDLEFDQEFIDEVCDMIMLNYSLISTNQQDRGDKYDLLPYRMRKIKTPKYNPLLIANDEKEKLDADGINEPTISEYFYQRTKKNYKTQYTEQVNAGISYNKSFVNIYRKMLKIENSIQEEIIADMEQHLPQTSSIKEKRQAKFKYYKQQKRIYQSLIYAKQQDLYKAQAKLEKIERDLANYEKEEKAYQEELRKQRRQQLRDYRLSQKVKDGEMTPEEAEAFKIKDNKRMNRKPRKKKEVEPVVIEAPQVPTEEMKRNILLERLRKANAAKHGKEEKVDTPKKVVAPVEPVVNEPVVEEVKPVEEPKVEAPVSRNAKLMEYLAKAKLAKHGKEVKIESKKDNSEAK